MHLLWVLGCCALSSQSCINCPSCPVQDCTISSHFLSAWFSTFLLSTFLKKKSHITTQHPKYNKTKQQTHTQHLKVQSKGRERGKDNKNTKVTPLYNHVYQTKKHCQVSMVEGLAPPTRAVAHSQVTICRRLRIQYVFPHMCGVNQFWIIVVFAAVKPANKFSLH